MQRSTGTSTVWRRISGAGRWLDSYFCPVCGSLVYAYAEFAPDMINVSIGNFADPSYPPPTYAVWNENKHPWVAVPDGCRTFARDSGK